MSEDDTSAESREDDAELNPKKRGLGRGLGALFDDEEGEDYGGLSRDEASWAGLSRKVLSVDQLSPGAMQPRHYIDHEKIDELAESIAVHGVLQPLLVRPLQGAEGQYEIIAGERRWRAAQKAQIHEVPVIVKDLTDETALEVALIENLQREDLNPLDEAQGFQRLIEEFYYSQDKVALELSKSRSYVANMVRLLNLPQKVQTMVRQGKLSAGHARTLITADDPEALANIIVRDGLSVREAEKLAAEKAGRKPAKSSKSKKKPAKDVDTLALEEEISAALGMKVSIDMISAGRGALKVDFESLDQLDEVLHRLSHFPGRKQTG